MAVHDHLGKEYASFMDLCNAYGISKNVYYSRLHYGWSQEEALTTPVQTHAYTDHKGNQYKNLDEMCAAYHVRPSTYQNRRKSGYSLEEALTMPLPDRSVQDHLGNTYSSIEAMCAHYGLSSPAFKTRYNKLHWSLEKSLTTPIPTRTHVDHLGNVYHSLAALCAAYHITPRHYHARIQEGWDLESVLTTPLPNRSVTDPDGKVFPSVAAMCRAYKMDPYTYKERIKLGWSQAEALKPASFTGCLIGSLKVLSQEGDSWKCQCVCGNIIMVSDADLRNSKVKDCGCGTEPPDPERNTHHFARTSVDGSDLLRTNIIRPNKQNTSGYRGIYYDTLTGKWISRIQFQKKRYCLGSYDTCEAAYDAYLKAKDELHGKYLEEHGIEKKW